MGHAIFGHVSLESETWREPSEPVIAPYDTWHIVLGFIYVDFVVSTKELLGGRLKTGRFFRMKIDCGLGLVKLVN